MNAKRPCSTVAEHSVGSQPLLGFKLVAKRLNPLSQWECRIEYSMVGYLLRRVVRALLAVLIAVTLTFFVLRLLPGGPVMLMLDGVNDPLLEAQLMSQYGLDQPLLTQYGLFLLQLVQGNLGVSFYAQAEVSDILMSRIPWTLLLAGTAAVLTLFLGIIIGVYAAVNRRGWQDRLLNIAGISGQALFVPSLAVPLLLLFSLTLGWLPIGGSGVQGGPVSVLAHLALPLLTLVLIQLGPYALTVRTNLTQVLGTEFMRSSAARGLGKGSLIWRHALPNALLPSLSLMGVQLGTLLGGAVLTETVFAYPGVGSLIYQSVGRQDFPVLQGAFILLAVTVVVANLAVDILSMAIDPRVKAGVLA